MDNLYIEKVLSGDRHAFRYFVKTYKDMAFSVALSVVKQEHLAQEVAQDAFLQCYLSLSSFKKTSKFSTWLYRIVVNCAYKAIRGRVVETVELLPDIHENSFESDALAKLLQQEQKQIINEALMRIPANESLALRLYYLQEVTLSELCQITGWSESNAKVILFRARKKIHAELSSLMKGTYYGA